MSLPVLVLPVFLIMSAPPALHDIRKAAAAGQFDGAAALTQSALAAEKDDSRRQELTSYQEALKELQRQDTLIRDVFAIGGTKASGRLIKALRESEKLKPHPELVAHGYRLERWGKEAEQLRSEAETALKGGDFDDAHARYTELSSHPMAQSRVPDLRDEIAKGLKAADPAWHVRTQIAMEGLVRRAWGWAPLKTTVLTLALFAFVWALLTPLRAFRAWRAKKSGRTELTLYDGTSETAAGSSEVLVARLKAIFFELARQPRAARGGTDWDLGEALVWIEEGPLRELEVFAQHLQGQVIVGPVSLPTKTLWLFLGKVVSGSRYRMEGVVTRSKDSTRVTLSHKDLVTEAQIASWTATAPGVDGMAVSEALRALSYKIAFDQMQTKPAASSEAFLAYRQALETLDEPDFSADRKKGLLRACQQLQRALNLDPGMARARLLLAIVLRKLGNSESSRALVQELQRKATDEQLKAEAELHEALLDAQSGKHDLLQKAYTHLVTLSQRPGKLGLDAKACLLDVCVTLLTHRNTQEGDSRTQAIKQTAEELKKEFLEASEVQGVTAFDYHQAHGYALYAVGRWDIKRGDIQKGLQQIERAVLYVPDLTIAYVEMARAYRRLKSDRWENAAEWALAQALQLDPNDPLLNEEYGRFLLARQPPRHEEAVAFFSKAADKLASSRLEWGKLLAKLGKPEEAIAKIWEAIAMCGEDPSPYHGDAIVNCVAVAASALRARVQKDAASSKSALPAVDPGAELLEQARKAVSWLEEQQRRLEKQLQQAGSEQGAPEVASRLKEAKKYLKTSAERLQDLGPWPPGM